ncbi:hypothetical protein MSG28_011797 [Choristoneura fumiferana]|uniref:Uncharacterized protein n=1 Tax=Choristoneura fumiferana TaxID=7141 RepID=A0ACC0KMG3_CHOFU|nr:hypothetical protein MSG28_011797 [Choristoneura fumiferana]
MTYMVKKNIVRNLQHLLYSYLVCEVSNSTGPAVRVETMMMENDEQWRSYRRARRGNAPGPPSSGGPSDSHLQTINDKSGILKWSYSYYTLLSNNED